MLETPILFLVFNRPDVTMEVFQAIRKAKPRQLFVAADGPRSNREGEAQKCEETRALVLDAIDWDCEVKTLFREQNLGCKIAVSKAITWFFENVEEGIILEDDCVPNPSFFTYCSTMLERYRNHSQVMHIGANYFNAVRKQSSTYYYTNNLEIWGWATWRRAWQLYDVEMSLFDPTKNEQLLQKRYKKEAERKYWLNYFKMAYENRIDTWDYQWVYCVALHDGIAIAPYVNLVSNLGFRADATHTTDFDERFSNVETQQIESFIAPATLEVNHKEDWITFLNTHQKQESIAKKIMRKITPKIFIGMYQKFRSK